MSSITDALEKVCSNCTLCDQAAGRTNMTYLQDGIDPFHQRHQAPIAEPVVVYKPPDRYI